MAVSTGWRHRLAPARIRYCVVPITSGTLRLEEPGGAREAELVTGQPYFREAGVEHDVINPNPYEFVFIDIEVKG